MLNKSVLIVAPYVTFPDEPGANRFIAIAQLLSKHYNVTLLTSRFCHILKKHRLETPCLDGVRVILIDEPGYNNNVGFARLNSHRIFCHNFEEYLTKMTEKFDLVYSAYPLIKTNFLLGKFKTKLNFKLIIDVQDIWPESIAGPIPILSNTFGRLLLSPVTYYANKTYSFADAIVAVSETYMKRADVKNIKDQLKQVVYIGADNLYFDCNFMKPEKEKLIATYIGTMAGSYDLDTIIKASALCYEQVEIQFIGTGPHEERLKKLNNELGQHVKFLGVMQHTTAMEALSLSDIALNPIKLTAKQSITNKISDYFCCGLPILSCQNNDEVKDLLSLGGGEHYSAGDFEGLAQKLISFSQNRKLLIEMSEINKIIAEDRFLRNTSYLKILDLVNKVMSAKCYEY